MPTLPADWKVIDTELRTEHGRYWCTFVAPDWYAARYVPGARPGARWEPIDTEEGEDWRTLEEAIAACVAHAERIAVAASAANLTDAMRAEGSRESA